MSYKTSFSDQMKTIPFFNTLRLRSIFSYKCIELKLIKSNEIYEFFDRKPRSFKFSFPFDVNKYCLNILSKLLKICGYNAFCFYYPKNVVYNERKIKNDLNESLSLVRPLMIIPFFQAKINSNLFITLR